MNEQKLLVELLTIRSLSEFENLRLQFVPSSRKFFSIDTHACHKTLLLAGGILTEVWWM